MIHPIRYYGDPVLRRRASEVTEFDADLKRLAADMIETMYAADGVGLAAPQIGVSKRLFVALEVQPGTDDDPDAEEGEVAAAERRRRWEERREHVIVNPRLVKREGQQFGRDGCLSLPGLYAEEVPRDLVVELEYQDLDGQPRTLRPETALDLAREEVVRLRKEGLLRGREVQFDPVTDWYLMAWDAFAAEQFPYDEARKLAIALGVDLDKTIMTGKRLAAKKGEFIVLQTPVQRRRKGTVDDEVVLFESWIDAAHTALMVYSEDGAGACYLEAAGDLFSGRSEGPCRAAGAARGARCARC